MTKRDLAGKDIFTTLSSITKEPLEVEFKMKVSPKLFISMIETFEPVDFALEQTTNAIYNAGDHNLIVSKNYADDKITKYTKKRIMYATVSDFPNMNISVSLEKPTNDSAPKNAKPLFRIKNRLSFRRGDWRYDFTQVIQIGQDSQVSNTGGVKSLAMGLFNGLTKYSGQELINQYIKSCSNMTINTFELEIELMEPLEPKHLESHSFIDDLGKNKITIKNILYYDLMLQSIAKVLNAKIRKTGLSIKSILPSAETLTRTEYNKIFPPIGYYISRKADGERALLISLNCGTVFLITDKLEQLNNFDVHHSGGMFIPINAIEGEILKGKYNEFLAYDILVFNGNNITNVGYASRIPKIVECCKIFTKLPIKVSPKPPHLITEDLNRSFKNILEEKFPFPEDGFVLTSPDMDYYSTKNYKIKSHNTIDFLAVKLPAKLYMKFPIEKDLLTSSVVYLLFCSTNESTIANMGMSKLDHYNEIFSHKNFRGRIPIQFAPSDNPNAYIWYATKTEDKLLTEYTESKRNPIKGSWVIVELNPVKIHAKYVEWKFIKIRDDRYDEPNYFGNDFTRVAAVNWSVCQDPLKLEEMHIGVSTYFNKGKDSYYFAQTSAMSFAKSKIMETAFKMCNRKGDHFAVIDCAAGRGQDFNRYIANNVTHLLAMDLDKVALSELITRYYDRVHDRRKTLNMQINIMPQDMTQQHTIIVDKIKHIWKINGVFTYPNAIVCNLAMHYFTRNIKELVNFVSFVKALLPTGSVFIYTTFDGKKVFNLLKEHDGDWKVQSEGTIRYRILRKYPDNEFSEFGKTIQVKLPFTGEDMYEENLVSSDYVNSVFAQSGIVPVKKGHMDEFLPALQEDNSMVFNALTEDDKKFIGLYHYTILQAK
jgi:hypothetical protein